MSIDSQGSVASLPQDLCLQLFMVKYTLNSQQYIRSKVLPWPLVSCDVIDVRDRVVLTSWAVSMPGALLIAGAVNLSLSSDDHLLI